MCVYMSVWIARSCPALCDFMDCSLPGSSVHGILQARTLKWIAIPFSGGSSWPRDQTWVSSISGTFFTIWATRDALIYPQYNNSKHLCLEYNNRVSKYMKQRKVNLRREIDKSTGIARDYPWKFFLFKYLRKQVTWNQQWYKRLKHTIKLDLTDIHNIFHPTRINYALPINVNRTIVKVDQIQPKSQKSKSR